MIEGKRMRRRKRKKKLLYNKLMEHLSKFYCGYAI